MGRGHRSSYHQNNTTRLYRRRTPVNTNRVLLKSGVSCELSAAYCTDIKGGNLLGPSNYHGHMQLFVIRCVIWWPSRKDHQLKKSCIPGSLLSHYRRYIVRSSKGKFTSCRYTLIRTEHPKLIIFETYRGTCIFRKQLCASNLDIFTHMNLKFVYVEKHIRTRITKLYWNVLYQQCSLKQKILPNSLAIATQSPDIFAYHLTKGPGYMAFLAGESFTSWNAYPLKFDWLVRMNATINYQLRELRIRRIS